jgi:predicted transcriptional regulator
MSAKGSLHVARDRGTSLRESPAHRIHKAILENPWNVLEKLSTLQGVDRKRLKWVLKEALSALGNPSTLT